MNVFSLVGIGFITLLAVVILKNADSPLYMPVLIIGGIIILIPTLNMLGNVFEEIYGLSEKFGVDKTYIQIATKCFGICLLTSFAVGVCNDSGESGLGMKISFAGKVIIAAAIVPILLSIMTDISKIIG